MLSSPSVTKMQRLRPNKVPPLPRQASNRPRGGVGVRGVNPVPSPPHDRVMLPASAVLAKASLLGGDDSGRGGAGPKYGASNVGRGVGSGVGGGGGGGSNGSDVLFKCLVASCPRTPSVQRPVAHPCGFPDARPLVPVRRESYLRMNASFLFLSTPEHQRESPGASTKRLTNVHTQVNDS